jgi:hypothetical protein
MDILTHHVTGVAVAIDLVPNIINAKSPKIMISCLIDLIVKLVNIFVIE